MFPQDLTPGANKAQNPPNEGRSGPCAPVCKASEQMSAKAYLSVSPEVKKALAAGQPVVALESTIITHGMPYPQNLEMAVNVEAVIRKHGAVPATIAIMDGRFCVGVSGEDLERLAQTGGTAAKASRRDVAALLVKGEIAGTTVATTMQIAALAGIHVFATGGIGGVHRGAEDTFDISADLEELSRTPVCVVCAGAKSILDIAKTLEVLETNGVPVLGYGTDDFPAFWARQSGHKVDHRFDDVADIARVIAMQADLGMGGVLVANPIPEKDALDPAAIEARIAEAIAGAEREGVSRKALTPFLLQRIFELTEGKSLVANIALVENNARVAAGIAVALASRSAPKPAAPRA
jgi:pseudouridine-5'-phosphate glycosidase